ncbi:FMN-binding negative transcriptional regulator [Arenibaculum sp.]|jgi:transcriptional regulator|uniref:FMN-binding negative transcriptional regulator n=1 Tax=Arenibaculum sp. TaxID=2865862 RepID=UPI002E141C0C|nr:FMN-binding negative transcriptional regulator [Arenibaculum sp.]
MYQPRQFEETRVEVMHDLIRAHPLATLVTLSPSGIEANHVPLHLRVDGSGSGTLVGHVARANPVWRDFDPAVEALAVFQGPEAYVTPSWYPTKAETGKAVPTWNYAVVHAHGPMRVIEDRDWLRAQIDELTAGQESAFPVPWSTADAPGGFIDALLRAIVGIEIPIARLAGKWKVSQNQPARNHHGVVAGLSALGTADAAEMAGLVAARGEPEAG